METEVDSDFTPDKIHVLQTQRVLQVALRRLGAINDRTEKGLSKEAWADTPTVAERYYSRDDSIYEMRTGTEKWMGRAKFWGMLKTFQKRGIAGRVR